MPKRLKKDPYKLVPILEIPFLADKKANIYLSLMKIRSCGILQPQDIPCNIINKKSDHYSNINWPSFTKNENIYINLGPANGESISWLKRNHKGHYIPPSKYFDGTLRRLPIQISLQLGKKRPVILNLKTENKYNLYDIYLNNVVDVF